MTIVMVGHKGVPCRSGGIERHVEALSAALVNLGVRVVSYDRKWYVKDAPAPHGIIRRWSCGINTKHLDAITHTFTALILAKRDKPQIVHIHGVGPSLLAPFARILHPKARIVATFHCIDRTHAKWGLVARTMFRLGESFTCLFAHRTITVSDALATYCLDRYQCQPAVIPNGVHVSADVSPASLSDYNLAPYHFIAMVTRLIPHKNVHVAIEAHRLLNERRPDLAKAFPLVIVGGSAWTSVYEKEIKRLSLTNPNILVLGEKNDEQLSALQAYAACHLSVASSEGMSIALLEAMAMGRPVIVSNIPENTEVTGAIAPVVTSDDAIALSRAMETMLCLTDEERDTIGAALRERVLVKHDWKNIAAATLDVYHELMQDQKKSHLVAATI
jgi:glycosyltransferase involved in cell wall biosynthesis